MKKITFAVIIAVAAIALILVLISLRTRPASPAAPAGEVTVGNKNFTEQYIIGQMMKQLLEDRGFKVNLVSDISTGDLRKGMKAGGIGVCADYTGTAWMVHLGHAHEPGTDNNKLWELVKQEDEGKGFVWLNPIWNNNTYALASWAEFAREHDVETLSDLAALCQKKEGKVKTFVNFEFSARPDGLPTLEKLYGFRIDEVYLMTGAPGSSLTGLRNRECEVAMVFGTDSIIAKYGWHVYPDDRAFFPPYDLTPCVRAEVLEKYPEITDILNELTATFPGGGCPAASEAAAQAQKVWRALNAKVDINKMEPDEVAHEYLVEKSLVRK